MSSLEVELKIIDQVQVAWGDGLDYPIFIGGLKAIIYWGILPQTPWSFDVYPNGIGPFPHIDIAHTPLQIWNTIDLLSRNELWQQKAWNFFTEAFTQAFSNWILFQSTGRVIYLSAIAIGPA